MASTDHERRDALPVGTVLRDFTIRAVIGHGGFGVVYQAGHNELDLTVAIKEYLPVELAVREGATVRPRSGTVRRDFEDGLRRFRDEAQVLVGFDSHPSIVSCRDFFRENGTAYLVMAYEEGRSLADVLASREAEGRPFTEADLLAVMRPVLDGLVRVHAAGVLHRDIKPSNILIRGRDERPVLIDFGAAKQAAARFSKSQAPYTEGYAALEQVADTGKLGPWTDIYGAGAVMWRMVAGGNRPWEPPHPVRVEQRSHAVVAAADDPMPSASELGQGRFQPRLLEAIDRCLRLRETERVQDARGLLEVLSAARGRVPAVVSAEATRRGASPQKRSLRAAPALPEPRPGRRTVGWLVLVSVVVGLGLVLPIWRDPGSAESVRDLGPAGASGTLGGEVTPAERVEASDTAPSPDRLPPNREPPSAAKEMGQVPNLANGSGPEGGEPETGRDSDDRRNMRSQPPQADITQPWIQDWDALDDINDPDFAATAQAYIEQYKRLPEASVWVAQAEGLLDKLRELESASPGQRPSNRVLTPEASDSVQVSEPEGTGSSAADDNSELDSGRDSDGNPKVRREQTQEAVVQPWIRDWDALGNIRDPGFAETAQAYIARYGQVSEASVWVAKAAGLLSNLRELEAPDRPPREVVEYWTNSLGMEFAWIPAGHFLMGSPSDEKGRDSNERQHEVRISKGFWMMTCEVTQGEWEAVMRDNPSHFVECGQLCPVENVSWEDAQEYIRKLNGRESGRGYRYQLPTEAEWEYAARAGTAGPRYGDLTDVAWFHNGSPQPVAQKRANRWGLYDVLGNVWEWTADRYGRYPAGPLTDPRGSPSGTYRVIRGGSWSLDWRFARFATRFYNDSGYRDYGTGFRLVRTE